MREGESLLIYEVGGAVLGIAWFSGRTEGNQLSLTEYKGGGGLKTINFQLTVTEGDHRDYNRALWGNQVNFIMTQPKSSEIPPPLGDKQRLITYNN